mmetsp:Transcript_86884/g.231786  ORF Transcript_86884/g.231786 Transcript_86884/m.231786 type:complete len:217 (+) Transcript_86884:209-859(+)
MSNCVEDDTEAIADCCHVVDDLIKKLQPHPRAEAHRYEVFQFVKNIIENAVQLSNGKSDLNDVRSEVHVCRFGSVPFKTYLPHGDLDVTAFAADDRWMQHAKEKLLLSTEGPRFVVRNVTSVPPDLETAVAEVVKVVKCEVGGVMVDISANALGGICTLSLLEKVDRLVNQDHLFKRSLVLVKAWCYFESHVLSSQYGLFTRRFDANGVKIKLVNA